jgi:hypothetical protein
VTLDRQERSKDRQSRVISFSAPRGALLLLAGQLFLLRTDGIATVAALLAMTVVCLALRAIHLLLAPTECTPAGRRIKQKKADFTTGPIYLVYQIGMANVNHEFSFFRKICVLHKISVPFLYTIPYCKIGTPVLPYSQKG